MPDKASEANLSSEDLCFTPAVVLREMMRQKRISPVEVVETFLQRIEQVNPVINAYCTVVPEVALRAAREAEAAISRGDEAGLLCGIPVSIKDVVMTAGIRTTMGSKLYENHVPDVDEIIVERLKRAGAAILGKTNTPEFAAGGNTFNEVCGATRNPWDTDYTVGGSSGGAGASIAAGIGPLGTGSDLGGSLRLPASFCGVIGLRPSPGRVPMYPEDLLWDDLSVQGPMARTVADTALMLDAISGPDIRNPISLPAEPSFLAAALNPKARGLRIAWSDNLNLISVESEVLAKAKAAIEVFRGLGAEVVEDTPDFTDARDVALILRGLRFVAIYQDRVNDPEFQKWVNPRVKGNIEYGLNLSVRDIARAHRQRSEMWDRVRGFFDRYDLLLTPTTPIPPFPVEIAYPTEIGGQPMESYLDWAMLTYAITMVGLPAISLPCGWTEKGLPVGLQVVGRHHGEAALLQAAAAYESAAPWADKRPSLG
jgi:amidase